MEWMFLPLKRYAEFSGRSRRMEYWMYALGLFIMWVILFFVMMIIFAVGAASATSSGYNNAPNAGGLIGMIAGLGIMMIFFVIIGLALFIPTLAVQIRRLHDSDRSGWWVMIYYGPYLLSLLISIAAIGAINADGPNMAFSAISGLLSLASFVGWIVLIVFSCLPGTPGPNRYGPDPLGGTADLSRTFQ